MRKYVGIVMFLVAVIFATVVSDTMAIYTKSFQYNFTLNILPPDPIFKNTFLSYEMQPPSYAEGSVSFDEENKKVTVENEAGALRSYETNLNEFSYIAHTHIDTISPQVLKNFGMFFNGSYADTKEIISVGYVLKFDNQGNLIVRREGFQNNAHPKGEGEHYDPDLKDYDHKGDHYSIEENIGIIATAAQLKTLLNGRIDYSDGLDIQARVTKNNESKVAANFYIEGVLINKKPFVCGQDQRAIYNGGGTKNAMLGISSYGKGTKVVVDSVLLDEWDGKDLTYHVPVDEDKWF